MKARADILLQLILLLIALSTLWSCATVSDYAKKKLSNPAKFPHLAVYQCFRSGENLQDTSQEKQIQNWLECLNECKEHVRKESQLQFALNTFYEELEEIYFYWLPLKGLSFERKMQLKLSIHVLFRSLWRGSNWNGRWTEAEFHSVLSFFPKTLRVFKNDRKPELTMYSFEDQLEEIRARFSDRFWDDEWLSEVPQKLNLESMNCMIQERPRLTAIKNQVGQLDLLLKDLSLLSELNVGSREFMETQKRYEQLIFKVKLALTEPSQFFAESCQLGPRE